MATQEADIGHENKVEIDEAPLLNYENERNGIYQPNTERSGSDEKQIQQECFDFKSVKLEEINVKSEDEDDHFNINNFNEKQVQQEYFDLKSIKNEEIDFKSEDEDDHQFNIESSETNKVVHLNPCTKPEGSVMFKCTKCCFQTHQRKCISTHVLCHKSNVFQCPHCLYRSNRKHDLKLHQLVHTPKEEAGLHKCPNCPFTSRWRRALIRHLLIHKTADEITWYHCSQCPYKTKHKHNLKNIHMLTHRKQKPMFKCALCSYESSRKCTLQNHLRTIHRPKDFRPISCPEDGCFYKTHDQIYLANHIKQSHECRKLFKCSRCPFETRYAQVIKEHELRHDNPDKWHSCLLCTFKTPYKNNLYKHAVVHTSGSEIKWFRCSKCPFKTKHNRWLKRHKVKHISEAKKITDWFYCYMCTWSTYCKQNLRKHIRDKHRDADGRICGD